MYIFEVIKKGTAEIIPESDLKSRLDTGIPLRVKLGIDASGPDIHLGFAVVLRKLKEFQDFGHKAILIVGDFTGKIGDPSGRSKTRPQLTDEEIKKNMVRYKEQVFKILDPEKTEFRYNSEWLSKLTAEDIIHLASHYTVARMLERDDFEKRLKNNVPISLHEFLYPLFQAYDSVAVNADVELGGTDQKFNHLLGRTIQQEYAISPQIVILMPLLEGLDGIRKMSKSYNNYIGITESPEEMYGKLMSIPDNLILRYFSLCLDISDNEVKDVEKRLKDTKVNPMDIKKELARRIVGMYHSKGDAIRAEEYFVKVFSKRELPEEIPTYILTDEGDSIWIVKLLQKAGLVSSNSEARRLISQGGVYINGEKITSVDTDVDITKENVIKAGKKKFLKLLPKQQKKC